MLKFEIEPHDHCRRVESFLQNLMPTAPLSYARKLIKSGHLALNGAQVTPDTMLRLGDTVTLKESARTGGFLGAARPEVDILYEDDRIMVIDKEPGIPVHRAAEDEGRNLVEIAEEYILRLRETEIKLRPVNRIDRGTSGAVIMAKSATSAGMFGRFVKETGLAKLYLAVAEGTLTPEGTITAPLDGKESETRYQVLFQGEGAALLAVWPISGRTHQIRRHLAGIGHPILGDIRYRGMALHDYPGHALHAFRVGLLHPETGRELTVHAPLPGGLVHIINLLAGDKSRELLERLPKLP
ncbi:MAG: RluA family pseudouridine synthase [Geobacter sp.]|nr:RluA family pseudouridine synthase [Geobacter sp.]